MQPPVCSGPDKSCGWVPRAVGVRASGSGALATFLTNSDYFGQIRICPKYRICPKNPGDFKIIVWLWTRFCSIISGETSRVFYSQLHPSSGGGAIPLVEFVLKINILWYG